MAVRKSSSKAKTTRPSTVAAYLASLPPEKRTVIEEARAFVQRHLPKGYPEFMNWGVINWGIPLQEFSNTHNGQPLCYVRLGAKKRTQGSDSTWGSVACTSKSSMISSSLPSQR
jgi:hypothetical protein